MTVSREDIEKLAAAVQRVPRARGSYLETDFVMNLLATVVDFQTHTTAVVRAMQHFKAQRWPQVRTMGDLKRLVAWYPDDQPGNTAMAEYLWGYKMWTRARMLRGLVAFFDQIGVRDQPSLHRWAAQAEFKRDFQGRVRGLGPAVFQWLVMRQRVDTVKPDVHVRRFAEGVLGRRLSDGDVVAGIVGAARMLGVPAYELDWAIWEYQRAVLPSGNTRRTDRASSGRPKGW